MDSLFLCFLLLSIFSYFPYPHSWISLHPHQYYLFCHFGHCNHDRLIHMLHKCDCLVFLLLFSEYFAIKISPELNVLILDKFTQLIFHRKCMITCNTHRIILFHKSSNSSDQLNYIFIIFVTSCLRFLLLFPYLLSIFFFMIKSAFSTTLYFSTLSLALHSWRVYSHAS